MDWTNALNALFVVLRWLHIISGMLIVGGAFVYEFVLPRALDDLKDEHQLAVFGKVRYAFRAVVLVGTLLLFLSGLGQTWQLQHPRGRLFDQSELNYWIDGQLTMAGAWCIAHLAVGLATLLYALKLTFGHKMPPMSRMRVNFVVLLVAVFLADVARHVRVTTSQQRTADLIHNLQLHDASDVESSH